MQKGRTIRRIWNIHVKIFVHMNGRIYINFMGKRNTSVRIESETEVIYITNSNTTKKRDNNEAKR